MLTKEISVCILGCGQMGSLLLEQLLDLPHFRVIGVADHHPERVKELLGKISLNKKAESKSNVMVFEDASLAIESLSPDCFIEATGDPITGVANIRMAIKKGANVVAMNAEADALSGPELQEEARRQGVVYTPAGGDEPACMVSLMEFAQQMGLEVVTLGKGKNNRVDLSASFLSPRIKELSLERGMNPRMLASFVDGTKTAVEVVQTCNATGFTPDVPGCHGMELTLSEIPKFLVPREDGGVLSGKKRVEFVYGVAPGVFAVVKATRHYQRTALDYASIPKKGDYYLLYRPFHLCSMEVPLSITKAVIDHRPEIDYLSRERVSYVGSYAKRDINKGEIIGGIGGGDVYGKALTITKEGRTSGESPLDLMLFGTHTSANSGLFVATEDIKMGESLILARNVNRVK